MRTRYFWFGLTVAVSLVYAAAQIRQPNRHNAEPSAAISDHVLLANTVCLDSGGCAGLRRTSLLYGRPGSAPAIIKGPEQQERPGDTQSDLHVVSKQSIFGSLRHASLFAQIGLFVILGLGAMGLGPIGLGRLFPVGGDRRQWRSGLLFSFAGLLSYGLICGLLFLS